MVGEPDTVSFKSSDSFLSLEYVDNQYELVCKTRNLRSGSYEAAIETYSGRDRMTYLLAIDVSFL